MAYDNTNSGALFENDRKESDRHPDIKGTINVDGVEYWCSGWNKVSKGGKNYISLSVQKKESKQAPRQQSQPAQNSDNPAPGGSTDYDEDIPF